MRALYILGSSCLFSGGLEFIHSMAKELRHGRAPLVESLRLIWAWPMIKESRVCVSRMLTDYSSFKTKYLTYLFKNLGKSIPSGVMLRYFMEPCGLLIAFITYLTSMSYINTWFDLKEHVPTSLLLTAAKHNKAYSVMKA